MEAGGGPGADDLTHFRQLADNPARYHLFHALRVIEARYRDAPRLGESRRSQQDRVRLGQVPELAFPPATIQSFRPGSGESPGRLVNLFFGLYGPHGPLPLHLTEYARDRLRNHRDPTLVAFTDMLTHRLMCLLYRAWAAGQPAPAFDRAWVPLDEDDDSYLVPGGEGAGTASPGQGQGAGDGYRAGGGRGAGNPDDGPPGRGRGGYGGGGTAAARGGAGGVSAAPGGPGPGQGGAYPSEGSSGSAGRRAGGLHGAGRPGSGAGADPERPHGAAGAEGAGSAAMHGSAAARDAAISARTGTPGGPFAKESGFSAGDAGSAPAADPWAGAASGGGYGVEEARGARRQPAAADAPGGGGGGIGDAASRDRPEGIGSAASAGSAGSTGSGGPGGWPGAGGSPHATGEGSASRGAGAAGSQGRGPGAAGSVAPTGAGAGNAAGAAPRPDPGAGAGGAAGSRGAPARPGAGAGRMQRPGNKLWEAAAVDPLQPTTVVPLRGAGTAARTSAAARPPSEAQAAFRRGAVGAYVEEPDWTGTRRPRRPGRLNFAADPVQRKIAALAGYGTGAMDEADAMPDLSKRHFAGHLAAGPKHAEGLRAILAAFFQAPVAIQQFVGHWLTLEPDDTWHLGHNGLGRGTSIGTRVWSRDSKFRIRVGPLDLKTYQRLLPGRGAIERMEAIVRNYVGDRLAWDVRLVLRAEEVPRVALGIRAGLGYNCWAGRRRDIARDADDLILTPPSQTAAARALAGH